MLGSAVWGQTMGKNGLETQRKIDLENRNGIIAWLIS